MTVENSILRLKAYEKNMNDETLKSHIRKQSKKNYDNMKAHILSGKKYKGHPIIAELQKTDSGEENSKAKGRPKKASEEA